MRRRRKGTLSHPPLPRATGKRRKEKEAANLDNRFLASSSFLPLGARAATKEGREEKGK